MIPQYAILNVLVKVVLLVALTESLFPAVFPLTCVALLITGTHFFTSNHYLQIFPRSVNVSFTCNGWLALSKLEPTIRHPSRPSTSSPPHFFSSLLALITSIPRPSTLILTLAM
jgi:hypothetical protein